jgi:hypothetical protein
MKVKDETMRDQARQKLKDFSLMYKYMSGDSYLFILTLVRMI